MRTLKFQVPNARTPTEGMEQVYDAFRIRVEQLAQHMHPTLLITGIVTTILMWQSALSDESRTEEVLRANKDDIQAIQEQRQKGKVSNVDADRQIEEIKRLMNALPDRQKTVHEAYMLFCERVVARLPNEFGSPKASFTANDVVRAAFGVVRAAYPEAVAYKQMPIEPTEVSTSVSAPLWEVFAAPQLDARILGKGATEAEAWEAAASTVQTRRAQQGDRVASFKEWLAEQTKKQSVSADNARVVEEWKDSVSNLFAQVVRWLAEDDVNQALRVETGKLRKEEQGLGSYEIAAMRISLGPRLVELIPVGRQVVGAIGETGDLGFLAEGRVDMKSRVQKYLLYRVVDGSKRKWIIMDDEQFLIQPLSKQSFESALQQLLS